VEIVMIVAADEDDVIGDRGKIPWHLPADLKRFRRLTSGQILVIGRITYESILNFRKGKPLGDNRLCLVVTRDQLGAHPASTLPAKSPYHAVIMGLRLCQERQTDKIFVCGGGMVYEALLPWIDRVELTRVEASTGGDVRLPEGWLGSFKLKQPPEVHPSADGLHGYRFETYVRQG
jgi:dihydrofolate reductase